jgi:hypothetical protein
LTMYRGITVTCFRSGNGYHHFNYIQTGRPHHASFAIAFICSFGPGRLRCRDPGGTSGTDHDLCDTGTVQLDHIRVPADEHDHHDDPPIRRPKTERSDADVRQVRYVSTGVSAPSALAPCRGGWRTPASAGARSRRLDRSADAPDSVAVTCSLVEMNSRRRLNL